MQQELTAMFNKSIKSGHTRETYTFHVEEYFKSNPPEPTAENTKKIQKHVIAYLGKLEDRALSYQSRSVALSAIRHYYDFECEDVFPKWKVIHAFLGEKTDQFKLHGYNHGEIQKLLNVANIMYRAIILLLCSSGIRREALCQIKLSDLELVQSDKGEIYKISNIYALTTHEYVAFTTPEATKAIKLYLEQEQPSVWLLPSKYTEQQQRKQGKEKTMPHIQPMAISTHLRKLAISAGVGSPKQGIEGKHTFRSEIPSTQGLKHFAITQMIKAKVDSDFRKLLTDHSIGVGKRYVDRKEQGLSDYDLLQEYLKAVNNLTIDQSNILKVENKELKQKDDRINQLENQLADNKKNMEAMLERMQEISLLVQDRKEDLKDLADWKSKQAKS